MGERYSRSDPPDCAASYGALESRGSLTAATRLSPASNARGHPQGLPGRGTPRFTSRIGRPRRSAQVDPAPNEVHNPGCFWTPNRIGPFCLCLRSGGVGGSRRIPQTPAAARPHLATTWTHQFAHTHTHTHTPPSHSLQRSTGAPHTPQQPPSSPSLPERLSHPASAHQLPTESAAPTHTSSLGHTLLPGHPLPRAPSPGAHSINNQLRHLLHSALVPGRAPDREVGSRQAPTQQRAPPPPPATPPPVAPPLPPP